MGLWEGLTFFFNRKSPLYDNCFLYAPDGQPLCTCDKKKARWYLNKGIGGKRTHLAERRSAAGLTS